MRAYKILVVDDDDEIRHALKCTLQKEHYEVIEAASGEEALHLLNHSIDLIILDIMMPEKDGLTTCVEIREAYLTPILFLTAKATEYDKCVGFSVGGDDYLQKPFSSLELLARISAILRRCHYYKSKQTNSDMMKLYVNDLLIDKHASRISKNGTDIALTNIEYNILLLLAENPGKIFTIENIYESVWGEAYHYSVNSTVVVHIKNLRRKLKDSTQFPTYIKNIWGRGYCIVNVRN